MLKCLPEHARGLPGVTARSRAWLGAPCLTLLVLSSLCPELLVSRCFSSLPILVLCHSHPVSLSQPGSPQGMTRAGGCLRTRLFLPPPSSCPCPEMLFIPRDCSTTAPRFGDFSSLGAIGAYLDPDPCQKPTEIRDKAAEIRDKAAEMFYGICGFTPRHCWAQRPRGWDVEGI